MSCKGAGLYKKPAYKTSITDTFQCDPTDHHEDPPQSGGFS